MKCPIPGCKNLIGEGQSAIGPAATSRYDNATKICAEHGVIESLPMVVQQINQAFATGLTFKEYAKDVLSNYVMRPEMRAKLYPGSKNK